MYVLQSADPFPLDLLNFTLLISSLNIGHGMALAKPLQRNFQSFSLLNDKSKKSLTHLNCIHLYEIKFTGNIIDDINKNSPAFI